MVLALALVIAAVGTSAADAPAVPDEEVQFNAAFDAMLRGDFAGASAGFKALAGSTASAERRASSAELARLADELIARGGKLSYAPGTPSDAPGAPVVAAVAPPAAVVAVSEDDSRDGGRASFVITTTMSSFYSGFVVLDLMDVDELRTGTLVVMGSTAVGVAGSIYGTQGRTMTGGMADAWRLGMFVGVGNALLLSEPLGLYDSTTNASEKVNTFVLASGWGLATAGLIAADHIRPTRAQVTVIETFGLMGVASTLMSLAIVDPNGLDGDSFTAITAAGLDLGLAAGAGFGGRLDWSHSRSRYVELSAFLGGLAGGGTSILLLADSNSDNAFRGAAAITLAGLWGGFALGTHLTRDMAPDYRFRNQGASAMLGPTSIRNAPGLALSGTF
ncbi:MAG TPA: hypothetical protein VIV40_09405 [Kofleriaceae bacterium]